MNSHQEAPEQLLEMVWQKLRRKDVGQALEKGNLLVQRFPDYAPGWHVVSHIAQLIRQPERSLSAIERALTLEPDSIDWALQRLSCLIMCGKNETAMAAIHGQLEHSGGFSSAQLTQLAFLCNRLELFDEAAGIYRVLIKREPGNGAHWYNLATIQRFRGEIEAAESSLDKAIALNSKDYQAYELRSDLRRQTPASNNVKQLQGLLNEGIGVPSGEVRVCFALAKELEDIGEPARSFKTLARGASLRRKHLNYRVGDDVETIEAIMKRRLKLNIILPNNNHAKSWSTGHRSLILQNWVKHTFKAPGHKPVTCHILLTRCR